MLLHELIEKQAQTTPLANALGYKNEWINYQDLMLSMTKMASYLSSLMSHKQQRVAIYAPKTIECVNSIFAVTKAGGVSVVMNPALKLQQVNQIIEDCSASILITTEQRYNSLNIQNLPSIQHIVLLDRLSESSLECNTLHSWPNLADDEGYGPARFPDLICSDIAAILYTSGSTGRPKGVVLSHQNLVEGARSVSGYLPVRSNDKLLAVLPISFDYGLSQLTIAFMTGASCYLQDYLFANDIITAVKRHQLTSLALVPPLWIQLANSVWDSNELASLRYFCNTGGAMPETTLKVLRQRIPHALPYMMFGLTEAFRSCYLPPDQIDIRPKSFGKAIPNARVQVINEFGEECGPFEHGELVHSGVLVSQGYWNDVEKTRLRFKPAPSSLDQRVLPEYAVWSGDLVYKDEEGFFYFVGRKDDQIKTSGYRVSPQEVEDVIYQFNDVDEVVVVGVPHPELGQAIVAIVKYVTGYGDAATELLLHCQKLLPSYMVPIKFVYTETLPKNANGKFDRQIWYQSLASTFAIEGTNE